MTTNAVGALSALLLVTGVPEARAAAAPPSASEASYREAREVLQAAIQAAGGASALEAIRDLTRTGAGTAFAQGQSVKETVTGGHGRVGTMDEVAKAVTASK
jgi:hypothetical protein